MVSKTVEAAMEARRLTDEEDDEEVHVLEDADEDVETAIETTSVEHVDCFEDESQHPVREPPTAPTTYRFGRRRKS